MFSQFSFYPKITLPTRFSNKHGTLVDNCMCKLTQCTPNTTAGIFTKHLTDHQPYFIFINTANPKIATPKYIDVNSLNPVAISNFVNGIKLSNIYNKLNKCTDADPNETYDIIHYDIELNTNIHLPETMVKLKLNFHKNSCWIKPGILRSIKYRDKLYKQPRYIAVQEFVRKPQLF